MPLLVAADLGAAPTALGAMRWRRARRLGRGGRLAPTSPSRAASRSRRARARRRRLPRPPARPGPRTRLLVALERLDEVADRPGPEQARQPDDRPGPEPAARRPAARLRRGRAAWLPRLRRGGARCRRSSGTQRPAGDPSSIVASASYRTIASRSSLRLSRLWATSIEAIARW